MLAITEVPDFRKFLASVLVKATKNEIDGLNQLFERDGVPWYENIGSRSKIIKSSFWHNHLDSYKIVDFYIHDNFTYYVPIELTLKNEQKSDVFTDIGFLIVDTNYGVIVLFFDEGGSIHKLEIKFRVEKKIPPFLFDLINHFPKDDPKINRLIINNINRLKVVPIDSYLRNFRRVKLIKVELD